MELLERQEALDAMIGCSPGRVILVSGEAGIGKTSLVRAYSQRFGARAIWGYCDSLRTPRPLGPIRDIARQAGGRIARVMAADSSRQLIFQSFLDLMSDQGPLLVIEDAHWADEATVDILVFAGRRIGDTRGLLVVTYREDEIGASPALRRFLGAVASDSSVLRLELSPLSLEAVSNLSRAHGVEPAALYARTGGNPFFVTEALADPTPTVPRTVRDAVLARASYLPEAAREVLDNVAIFPGHARPSLIHGPQAALDACVSSGMLVRDKLRVRFRHELARVAIEESIPPGLRTSLHARAMCDLASRGAEPAQLAYHAEEADDVNAVLFYAPEAARRASALGAHCEAADHYSRALRFASALPNRERAELLEQFAEECCRVGRDQDAIDAAERALVYWREEADREHEACLLARSCNYLWRLGRAADARVRVQQALKIAEGLPPGRGLVAAFTWSAMLFMISDDSRAAMATGRTAVALAEQFEDSSMLARALNAVGCVQWLIEPKRAEATMLRGLEIARRIGDDTVIGVTLINMGSAACEARHYDVAEHWLREAISWCSQHDMDGSVEYATAYLIRRLFETGKWDEASAMLDTVGPANRAPSEMVLLAVRGRLQARLGDPTAEETLGRAWRLARDSGEIQRLWPVAAGIAELNWLKGRQPDKLVRETFALAARLGHPWAIGELGHWLGMTPGQLGGAASPYLLEPALQARAFEELGCPYDAALALAADPDRLRDALTVFERMRATAAAQRIARMMRDRGQRPPRKTTRVNPYGLTVREMDVLPFVVRGMRNSEIAQHLHITEKTVDHHVSAILGKVGVRTRRDLAKADWERRSPHRGW